MGISWGKINKLEVPKCNLNGVIKLLKKRQIIFIIKTVDDLFI